MTASRPSTEKLQELHDLIADIEIAMMTTRSADGSLVSRPMETQRQQADGDLWFVTNIETDKVGEIESDPNICLGYYDSASKEWVSVSGTATICRDRAKIRELHQPDWEIWFSDEGGDRDGGPEDPRLALIFVEPSTVHYMKSKFSAPRVLFEIAKSKITGERPDVGREEQLDSSDFA